MNIADKKKIADLYRARGPMTRPEFLVEHGLTEGQLRTALKASQGPDRQIPLPFAQEGVKKESKDERIAELEASNKRLLRALKIALLALETSRDKADASLVALRASL